jgi:hypothetical protein
VACFNARERVAVSVPEGLLNQVFIVNLCYWHIAIVFDFVNPVLALWRLIDRGS